MKGWTVADVEVELTPAQEQAVIALVSTTPCMVELGGRGWGRSTVLYTAVRYDEYQREGRLLPWQRDDSPSAPEPGWWEK